MLRSCRCAFSSLCLLLFACLACSEPAANDGANPAETPAPDTTGYVYLTFDNGPFDSSGLIDKYLQIERLPITIFISPLRLVGNATFRHYLDLYRDHDYIALGLNPPFDTLMRADTSLHQLPVRLSSCNYWQIGDRQRGHCDTAIAAPNIIGWDVDWRLNPETAAPVRTAEEVVNAIVDSLRSGATFTPHHLVVRADGNLFHQTWDGGALQDLFYELEKHHHLKLRGLGDYPGVGER